MTLRLSAVQILAAPLSAAEPVITPAEMAGYLLVPHEKVAEEFDGGFSLYVPAWPLLKSGAGMARACVSALLVLLR